jgi:hypothetical protein
MEIIVKKMKDGSIVRVPYSMTTMMELIEQLHPFDGDPLVDDYYVEDLHERRPEWD